MTQSVPDPAGPAERRTPARQPVKFTNILRTRIFAGMVILVPLITTLWMALWIGGFLYAKFQGLLRPNIVSLGTKYPALSAFLQNEIVVYLMVIVLSIVVIGSIVYLAGLLSTAFVIRRVLRLGEKIIGRIPVINFLYNILKQIMDAIALQRENKERLQRVALIEYPRKGIYGLGFVTGETVVVNGGQRYVNLFLPTTPNPTSGFMLLLPPDQVFDTNLTIEQGVRFIVSGGILQPENLHVRPFGGALRDPLPPATIGSAQDSEEGDAASTGATEAPRMQAVP